MKNSLHLFIACILSLTIFSSCSLINKTCSADCAKKQTEEEVKTEKKVKKNKKAKKTEVQSTNTEVKN